MALLTMRTVTPRAPTGPRSSNVLATARRPGARPCLSVRERLSWLSGIRDRPRCVFQLRLVCRGLPHRCDRRALRWQRLVRRRHRVVYRLRHLRAALPAGVFLVPPGAAAGICSTRAGEAARPRLRRTLSRGSDRAGPAGHLSLRPVGAALRPRAERDHGACSLRPVSRRCATITCGAVRPRSWRPGAFRSESRIITGPV